jgi:predicted MFS family arabinose efflux permease
MTGAFQFGGAAGAALGGQLVQHFGPTAAFYGSTVITALTGLWLWVYRGRLASARDTAIAQL